LLTPLTHTAGTCCERLSKSAPRRPGTNDCWPRQEAALSAGHPFSMFAATEWPSEPCLHFTVVLNSARRTSEYTVVIQMTLKKVPNGKAAA
jgi:hypothetical protein